MNILIDLRALQSGNISGVEVFVLHLTRHLCKEFRDTKFLLWTNSKEELPSAFPEFSFPNATRFHTKRSNRFLSLTAAFLRRPHLDRVLTKEARRIAILGPAEKIDIVLIPDPRPFPVSKEGKKILVIHDLTARHFPRNFSKKTRLWHRLLRLPVEIEESARILTPSRFTKSDIIKELGLPEKKITVVGAGVPEYLSPVSDSMELDMVRKKYNLPERFLLTLSTLEPRKNIENLITAFRRFQKKHNAPELGLVVAGKQNPRIFHTVSLSEEDSVFFPGFIEEKDKSALFSMTQGFIYPSFFEGFGFPVLEAMVCGVPVACSHSSSLPEVYGDAALTFDPTSVSEMTEAIEALFLRKNLTEELSRKGRERSNLPEFSWQTVARKTMAVFQEVFEKKKKKS